MWVALDAPPDDDARRYRQLAVFPDDEPIPRIALERLWGREPDDVQALVETLAQRSLVTIQTPASDAPEPAPTAIRVKRALLLMLADDLKENHLRLVQAYAGRCSSRATGRASRMTSPTSGTTSSTTCTAYATRWPSSSSPATSASSPSTPTSRDPTRCSGTSPRRGVPARGQRDRLARPLSRDLGPSAGRPPRPGHARRQPAPDAAGRSRGHRPRPAGVPLPAAAAPPSAALAPPPPARRPRARGLPLRDGHQRARVLG